MMKRVTRCVVTAVMLMLASVHSQASDDALKYTTDILCLAPDATALAVAIAKHDTQGLKQLGLSTATCLVVNYGLELCIKKDRPDGTGHHAFPSTHNGVFPHTLYRVLWRGDVFTPTVMTGGTCWAEQPSVQAAHLSLPALLLRMLT